MAVVANRKRLAVAADALGMDAVLKLLLDTVVTLTTGVGNVVGVDARGRIGSGEDMVSGMATGAGRGHRQSVLEQSSVDALGVVGDNFVLEAGVAHSSLLTLAVTARTQVWNIDGKGCRLRVLFAEDSMGAVAILADRCVGIVLGDLLSVDAGDVELANFIVASGAIDFVSDGLTRPDAGGVDFGMALAAGDLAVAGVSDLIRVDVHGLAVARAAQLLVGVATHAVCIRHAQLIEDVPDLVRLMAVRTGG